MFTRSMWFSAMVAVATTSQAAVPGEIIAAINTRSYQSAVMSPDGSNFAYVDCPPPGNFIYLTHMGSPRYFAGRMSGSNVLYVDEFLNEVFNAELAAADENCEQVVALSSLGNMHFILAKWSPDGTMIAADGREFEFGNPTPIRGGIYLADVVYTGDRPTGISNLRLLIDGLDVRYFDWSSDSGRLVFPRNGDLHVHTLATGLSVNITNTPGMAEDIPAWSSTGRIAYTRVSATSRSGDRLDIFSIPETGGPELQVTKKSSVSSLINKSATYSPDGQYLAFSSCPSYTALPGTPQGACALYKIKADGSGKATRIVGDKNQSWAHPNWRR